METLEQAKKSVPVGFFIYPLMQVANILMPRAHLVPVGDDQLPHIEMTRDVARALQSRDRREVFPVPEPLVWTRCRGSSGCDGDAKMSKSLGNTIDLKDDAETVRQEGDVDVHRPDAPASDGSRARRRQPRVHVPRRLQPGRRPRSTT